LNKYINSTSFKPRGRRKLKADTQVLQGEFKTPTVITNATINIDSSSIRTTHIKEKYRETGIKKSIEKYNKIGSANQLTPRIRTQKQRGPYPLIFYPLPKLLVVDQMRGSVEYRLVSFG
jgi:hypothetical protein